MPEILPKQGVVGVGDALFDGHAKPVAPVPTRRAGA